MLEAMISHYTNGNKSKFANILGVSPQTISAWVARNTFDSELLYAKCSDLSAEWLLAGKGQMLKGDNPITAKSVSTDPERGINYVPPTYPTGEVARQPEAACPVPQDSKEGIPLLPLSALAGTFTGETTVMEYECERYVIPAFKGADFLIQVKGDSMQPTYYSGDLVACQRVPLNDLFFQWNKTYVLDTVQGPLIKRVRRGSDDNHVLIVSDNTNYEPFELSKEQFHSVALVRGLVRLE